MVYIKGMEIPASCCDCPLCYDMMECSASTLRFFNAKELGFDFCKERHSDCPLIPASDVHIVVKAKWIHTNYRNSLICSNCGNPVAFSLKDDGWHYGEFCPKCGAKMEES